MSITREAINSSSNDELFNLLGRELESRIASERGSPDFIAEIKGLPPALRAMAATYELDVSLALDDLGWHFGNWHNQDFAEETLRGLELLGANELAELFRTAFEIAKKYWAELASENWMEWYHGSSFEKETKPLTQRAWSILDRRDGIFKYWVEYAKRHPDQIGVSPREHLES